jgi:hypothetical protein
MQGRLPNAKGLHLYGVRIARGAVFIAGEQGLLLKSADGGASFAALVSPYKGSFFGLLAARSGTLMAYGLRGNAWRSADAGASWDKVDLGTAITLQAGLEREAELVLLGQTGELFVSRDDGRTFASAKAPAGRCPPPASASRPTAPGSSPACRHAQATLNLNRLHAMHAPDTLAAQPVVARLEDFDTASGSLPERVLFNHRPWVGCCCACWPRCGSDGRPRG